VLDQLLDQMNPGATQLTPPVGAQDHVRGPATAPVTLVEYGDYECPDCGRAYPIVKQLRRQFGDQMRFCFRAFPLRQIHPYAEIAAEAAEAAEAAGAQGNYFPMHDMLFEHQQALAPNDLVRYAAALGLDVDRFARALETGEFAPRVQQEYESGLASGVQGTPTFYVNGRMHRGSYGFEAMAAAIERALHLAGAAHP
jgi:protein-disulfide isomerase